MATKGHLATPAQTRGKPPDQPLAKRLLMVATGLPTIGLRRLIDLRQGIVPLTKRAAIRCAGMAAGRTQRAVAVE